MKKEQYIETAKRELKQYGIKETDSNYILDLDNFKGIEDNFVSFYFVFKNKNIKCEARMLYMNLLTNFLLQNNKDENEDNYVVFTEEEARKEIGLKKNQFIDSKKELSKYGLIEDKRIYGKKPNKIYLKFDNKKFKIK